MTDPELTPAQEEAVRALLRDARHTEPTPEHVVARLDARLAELTAHRDDAPPATVVPLAARRRRRAAALLVAAAAVVAGGVALPQLVPLGMLSGGEDHAATTSDAGGGQAEDEAGFQSASEPESAGREVAPEAPLPESSTLSGQARKQADLGTLPRLTSSGSLERQAARALRGTAYAADAAGCPLPTSVPGRQVPVTYDGAEAVMLVRDVSAGRQRVTVYLCGATLPVDTATLAPR